jgi:two-component system, chemotaxis family, protein-glutamate methylesterase/glutaminase
MINAEGVRRDVIVIGGSAGGFPAVSQLLEMMPPHLGLIVSVVLHRSPIYASQLASILTRQTGVEVVEAADGVAVQPNLVMIAPQDRHMVSEDGHVRVKRGPKEHFTRPAIDPLFRSAACTYGRRTVGVVLSGSGGDGAAGLAAIKAAGGVALVQDPSEARFAIMPITAIREDNVDGVFTLAQLAEVLARLAGGKPVESPRAVETPA